MDILTHCRKSLKLRGIIVLDAHRDWWDILATARYMSNHLKPINILMPIAGYVMHIPMAKQVVDWFARRYSISFIPVYRRDEYAPVNSLMRFLCLFYPRNLTRERREKANLDYINKTLAASALPSNVVIVAPYGSPLWFGKKIKYGVRKLLDQENRITYISWTMWSWKSFKVMTYLREYHDNLEAEFKLLTQRS